MIAIDIVSDIVCPWCYLGSRRRAAACGYDRNDVAAHLTDDEDTGAVRAQAAPQ